ncbi:hypothetical protein [Kutzneria buriramensis]|uniref:MmpS family membrane protein n=1 Tax=Kutzneria buriramensis TaxID=1045776 RepID=A0A3E0HGV3_9PSEU|nr:hypothetical protein [Kutzneria buriramensis]REH44913.1 hypothetical protein BCF44_108394 [Kutzneria buriramensis]
MSLSAAAAVGALAACSPAPAPTRPAATTTTTASNNPFTFEYRVEALDGKPDLGRLTYSYLDPSTGRSTDVAANTALPWSKTFTVTSLRLDKIGITLHHNNTDNQVRCTILMDGDVVVRATAKPQGADTCHIGP